MDEVGARSQVHLKPPKHILELENQIVQVDQKKIDVVKAQKYEEAAKLRDEERRLKEDLEIETEVWTNELNTVRKEITEEDVANVVSMVTGIPVSKVSQDDLSRLKNMANTLMSKVIGQDLSGRTNLKRLLEEIEWELKVTKNQSVHLSSWGQRVWVKLTLAKKLAEEMFGTQDLYD